MNTIQKVDKKFIGENIQCCCIAEIGSIPHEIPYSLNEEIRELVALGHDWKVPVASWLVSQFVEDSLKDQIWATPQDDRSPSRFALVHSMNLSLTQMVGVASSACESARNAASSAQSSGASSLQSLIRLEPISAKGDAIYAIGDILEKLALVLLRGLEARDAYDYSGLLEILDQVDEMPMEFKSNRFSIFDCLRILAQAGQSRTKTPNLVRESINIDDWENLSKRILEESSLVHPMNHDTVLDQCMAHPMLILLSSIGHMKREHAATLLPELLTLVFAELDHLDDCWSKIDASGFLRATNHNIEYYRYFAYHVLAIAIASHYPDQKWIKQLEVSLNGRLGNVEFSEWLDLGYDAYRMATGSIERALSLVPETSVARRDYYELTSENLEHEMSLRLELLRQKVQTESDVEELAKNQVEKAMKIAVDRFQSDIDKKAENLQGEVRSISIRVVEIIGIFLAIVAFLGTAVVSGTAGELPVEQRILILITGGVVSLLYFVLLRWVILRPIGSATDFNSADEVTDNRKKKLQ